jgi:ferredoxin
MALSLGCELLESGVPEVYCLDTGGCTPGWEVYRRRFRILGGRILRASPVELRKKAPLLWELRLKDDLGVRVLEVAWVVSAGPFRPSEGIREYPPGSCLFELEQSAGMSQSEDPQGWVLEEERGRLLATRIIKALGNPMGAGADRAQGRELREQLDEVQRSARQRLKRAQRYLEAPLDWTHEGKWSTPEMLRRMKSFPGVPGREQAGRTVASIECIEEIECNLCETACPEHAITISRGSANAPSTFLNESACTGCGKCISACPARVPVMIQERESVSAVQLTIARPAGMVLREKELVQVTNRDGRTLGAAKVLAATEWLKLEMPAHLASEARGVRRSVGQLEDEWVLRAEQTAASKVEVQLQGEKRMLRMGQPLALALFETGYARGDDRLLCRDGSCRRCEIRVDGVKKLACRTQVHRGMSIQLIERPEVADAGLLCPCSGVTVAEIEQKISEGKLRSPSSIRQACRVGEGSCRGRTCMGAFRRLVEARGVAAADWIDWRFPWADWTLSV